MKLLDAVPRRMWFPEKERCRSFCPGVKRPKTSTSSVGQYQGYVNSALDEMTFDVSQHNESIPSKQLS